MSEIPHSETASEKLNKLDPKKTVEVDLPVIADMLNEKGLQGLAAEVRGNAQNQAPEGKSFKLFEEMQEAEHQKIEVEAAERPPRISNPLLHTLRAGTKTQAKIDNIIKQIGQNKPSSTPNAPKVS